MTSRCSLTGTSTSPSFLIGSAQLELAAIDLEALRGQRLGDVGRGDRAVQRFGLADLAGDDDLDVGQPIGDRLGDLLLLGFLGVELGALALDLLLVAVGRQQRQLARQQVVARVAVGDLHDLAAAPEVVDVFSQNHFHIQPLRIAVTATVLRILHLYQSVTYGISAIWRARLIAVCSLRWCIAQVPEMRRGRILPRSGTNGPSSLTSL